MKRIIFSLLGLFSFTLTAQEIDSEINTSAEEIEEQVIEWRRDFHQHPELSNRETETAKKIADHLSYKWFHIPLSIFSQKKSFKEDSFFDYWNFSDTLTNSPILMDYTAVKEIANSKYLSKEIPETNHQPPPHSPEFPLFSQQYTSLFAPPTRAC